MYCFKGVRVIEADNWLRIIPNPYQLEITQETEVFEDDTNVDSYPHMYYNLVGLDAVDTYRHAETNLIGW